MTLRLHGIPSLLLSQHDASQATRQQLHGTADAVVAQGDAHLDEAVLGVEHQPAHPTPALPVAERHHVHARRVGLPQQRLHRLPLFLSLLLFLLMLLLLMLRLG